MLSIWNSPKFCHFVKSQPIKKRLVYSFLDTFQDLYCVRSDLGNLLKALGRLDEAKVRKGFVLYGDVHTTRW